MAGDTIDPFREHIWKAPRRQRRSARIFWRFLRFQSVSLGRINSEWGEFHAVAANHLGLERSPWKPILAMEAAGMVGPVCAVYDGHGWIFSTGESFLNQGSGYWEFTHAVVVHSKTLFIQSVPGACRLGRLGTLPPRHGASDGPAGDIATCGLRLWGDRRRSPNNR